MELYKLLQKHGIALARRNHICSHTCYYNELSIDRLPCGAFEVREPFEIIGRTVGIFNNIKDLRAFLLQQ